MATQTEAAAVPPASGPAERAPMSAWVSLLVLVALGLYTYMDRQIFGLQAEPLRKALGLSDLQFGLLQGVSVALFAAVVGYPIAWLSDRFDRRTVLAGCIATWSLAVGACGLARDFNELFVTSALVGAAEAGLLPIAYALIPELFRGGQRQLANSLFIVTGRLVVGLVIAMCGWMIHAIDLWRPLLPDVLQALPTWRLAFFATALPGIVFMPMILLLPIGKRKSTVLADGTPAVAPADKPTVWPFLRSQRFTFFTFMLSVGLLVFGFGATGAFIPAVAMRQMGMSSLELGNAMGIATFVSAGVGLLIANAGMKWLARFCCDALPGENAGGAVHIDGSAPYLPDGRHDGLPHGPSRDDAATPACAPDLADHHVQHGAGLAQPCCGGCDLRRAETAPRWTDIGDDGHIDHRLADFRNVDAAVRPWLRSNDSRRARRRDALSTAPRTHGAQ